MTHRIFTYTEVAVEKGMDWDEAIYSGEIETVEEFETYEEAVEAYEDRYAGYNDQYGAE